VVVLVLLLRLPREFAAARKLLVVMRKPRQRQSAGRIQIGRSQAPSTQLASALLCYGARRLGRAGGEEVESLLEPLSEE
jgi:hypothetical protein